MLRAVADTHTVVWYLFDDNRLSSSARSTIEASATAGDLVALSSITLAEIIYPERKDASTLLRLIVC